MLTPIHNLGKVSNFRRDEFDIMASLECAVCAWRATCAIKYNYQSIDLHCKEYSEDITLRKKPADDDNKKDSVAE